MKENLRDKIVRLYLDGKFSDMELYTITAMCCYCYQNKKDFVNKYGSEVDKFIPVPNTVAMEDGTFFEEP